MSASSTPDRPPRLAGADWLRRPQTQAVFAALAAKGHAARAVGAAIQGVDGEVAPAGVRRPVVGEGDGGVSAVRLDVPAQRGDLVGHAVGDDGDRAVGDAGRHRAEARGLGGGDHILGARRGGNVDVDDGSAEQRLSLIHI